MNLSPRDIVILRLEPSFVLADVDSGLIVSTVTCQQVILAENAIRHPANNITIDHHEGIVLRSESEF